MVGTPPLLAWRKRAVAWALRHQMLTCPRCPGQTLYVPDEDRTRALVWLCIACGAERVWNPPVLTEPRFTHLIPQVDLSLVPRRVVLGVRTRLAQRTSPVLIAREFRLQRQIVTAIRKAWEAEDDAEAVV